MTTLREEVTIIKENFTSLISTMGRIERVLVGDDNYKEKGLVKTVQENSAYVNAEKIRSKLYWRIFGATTTAAVLIMGILKFVF